MAARREPRRGAVVAAVVLALSLHVAAASPAGASEAAQSCPSGYIALTFDDGPGVNTGAILDLLAGRSAVATFFVTGTASSGALDVVGRAAAEGHVIANHTWAHDWLTRLADWRILESVRRLEALMVDAGIPILPLVRPPFMATSSRVQRVLGDAGYSHILWTVDPQDWRGFSSGTISRHVTARLAPNAVVLFHDGGTGGANTLGALPSILDAMAAGGYCTGLLDAWGNVVPPPDPEESVFAREIALLFEAGITDGCGEGRFCPHEPVTRAQMISFLERSMRHLGLDVSMPADWTPNDAGSDGDAVTRAQAASMLVAAFGLAASEADHFGDDDGSPHEAAVNALAAAGATSGCGGGRFCPDRPLPRDELAGLLVRLLGLGD